MGSAIRNQVAFGASVFDSSALNSGQLFRCKHLFRPSLQLKESFSLCSLKTYKTFKSCNGARCMDGARESTTHCCKRETVRLLLLGLTAAAFLWWVLPLLLFSA